MNLGYNTKNPGLESSETCPLLGNSFLNFLLKSAIFMERLDRPLDRSQNSIVPKNPTQSCLPLIKSSHRTSSSHSGSCTVFEAALSESRSVAACFIGMLRPTARDNLISVAEELNQRPLTPLNQKRFPS